MNKHLETSEYLSVRVIFSRDDSILLLDVSPENINLERVRNFAKEKGLFEKKEFHFTIIGSKTTDEILKKIKEGERENVLNEIEDLSKSIDWEARLRDEVYYIKKEYPERKNEIRESIIQIAKIRGLEDFYKKLQKLIGIEFEIPLPHVTIFSNSTNPEKRLRGIGIYSEKQFRKMNPIRILSP
ncbi:hypothetical protein HOD82_04180 [bacterium]|jgi:hypothetical protein|nr:hypothetical protein [bacterium]MBT4597503.1 hypothetical protein [bacterium]MBT6756574.1 hypothetical protein [Candidatus Paceibacterota bacterium]